MTRYACRRHVCGVYALASADMLKVAGEAQGNDEDIKKLLKDLNKGPSAAHVVKVEKQELDLKEGESSFEVR